MSNPNLILLVDDETSILDVVRYNLERANFRVITARDGIEAIHYARTEKPDLIILDLMLPGMDGFEVCRQVRSQSEVPIIMLTAKDEEIDRVVGLELGADDYVQKPFSIQQLVLRIEAVLRRTQSGREAQRTIRIPGMTIDTANLSGQDGGSTVSFTKREIELLTHLAEHADRPVSREELLLKVWGYARNLDIETRTVDIHIAKLRRKIEADPKSPRSLVTVRGAGYRLLVES